MTMIIHRIFHVRYHGQTSFYHDFGNARRTLVWWCVANKCQLLTQYHAATAKILNLAFVRQSSYRSLCENLLPVVCASPTVGPRTFSSINSLAFAVDCQPSNHQQQSVLDRNPFLSARYCSSSHGRRAIEQCLTKSYLHQSSEKMVWPTGHDRPQNDDGTEVWISIPIFFSTL